MKRRDNTTTSGVAVRHVMIPNENPKLSPATACTLTRYRLYCLGGHIIAEVCLEVLTHVLLGGRLAENMESLTEQTVLNDAEVHVQPGQEV